jgi:hypothetical protein
MVLAVYRHARNKQGVALELVKLVALAEKLCLMRNALALLMFVVLEELAAGAEEVLGG